MIKKRNSSKKQINRVRKPKKKVLRKIVTSSHLNTAIVEGISTAPWAVSSSAISALNDDRLSEIMKLLIKAEVQKCGGDSTKVIVNSKNDAADDGCDGYSPGIYKAGNWLEAETCWQFKAGSAGQPKKLEGEILKKIPKATLMKGGSFILVAAGSVNGEMGIRSREKKLKDEAKKKRLPSDKIRVFSSESLENWINEYPSIAAKIKGLNLVTLLDDWFKESVHQDEWVPSEMITSNIDSVRKKLEFLSPVRHIHIYGRPGVGKTRFALELCRDAEWKYDVLYMAQYYETQAINILQNVVENGNSRIVLIIDEVPQEKIGILQSFIDRANGRIRVITIGHDRSLNKENIEEIEIHPIENVLMQKVILNWYPNMLTEQVEFIANFSDGFIKLARISSYTIATNPNIDTAQLLRETAIAAVMNKMFGSTDNLRSLHVLASLTSVGWVGESSREGESIANHLDLNWTDVRHVVDGVHKKFGIAPFGGELRYVSPTPLGSYLAMNAWDAYPDKMRSIVDVLPNDRAKTAYFERLNSVATRPDAKVFAEQELTLFFLNWENFTDANSIERWLAFSNSNPIFSAENTRKVLETLNVEQLSKIRDRARRYLIRGLNEFAWMAQSFDDAIISLAYLAIAENESWSNNATGEFVQHFQIRLGATAATYFERLSAIDYLVESRNISLLELSIQALSKAGKTEESRSGHPPKTSGARQKEWQPSNSNEHIKCIEAALQKLEYTLLIADKLPIEIWLKSIESFNMMLRYSETRELVGGYIEAIVKKYPEARERVALGILRLVVNEKKYWKAISEADFLWLENFHSKFIDNSLNGKFRQALTLGNWHNEEVAIDKIKIDKEFIDRDLIAHNWTWLTSGDVPASWRLGEIISDQDNSGDFLQYLIDLPDRGDDLRIFIGYMGKKVLKLGVDWLDHWLDNYAMNYPNDIHLLIELTWRCSATERGEARISELIRINKIDRSMAERFMFLPWAASLKIQSFRNFIQTLIGKKFFAPAAALLENRFSTHSAAEELKSLEDLVLKTVCNDEVLSLDTMTVHYWEKLAFRLLPKYGSQIAKTIFKMQSKKRGRSWFLEHSPALSILWKILDEDPMGTWEALLPYLEDEKSLSMFLIGFPEGVVDRLPKEKVLDWVSKNPANRAPYIAKIVAKSFLDDSLSVELLNSYFKMEEVKESFFSAYISGGWVGPASQNWLRLSDRLRPIAKKSSYGGVRQWALRSISNLQKMYERDLKREAEEKLRGRF